MRIEAVTVCLHYDDFLEQTIRVNQSLFDDWVVVTSQADAGTIAVCQRYGVRTAFCPYFQRGGEKFAKALAINIGLAHLKLEDWVVHLDADTALPRNARRHLANVELDPSCIYGIDRVECPSLEAWHSCLVNPDPYEKHYFYHGPTQLADRFPGRALRLRRLCPDRLFSALEPGIGDPPLPQRAGLGRRAYRHAACPPVAAVEARPHPGDHGGPPEYGREGLGRELARRKSPRFEAPKTVGECYCP